MGYDATEDGRALATSRASAKEAAKRPRASLWLKRSTAQERRRARASTLSRERLDSEGDFAKLKPRLAAGGRLQAKGSLAPSEVSSPTASTSSALTATAMGASQCR